MLVFFSGADRVPSLGFQKQPSLVFLHGDSAKLPTASTCDLQLRLPANHKDFEAFKEAILLGVKGNDGFGGV